MIFEMLEPRSGNVFANLGLAEPDTYQLHAQLALRLIIGTCDAAVLLNKGFSFSSNSQELAVTLDEGFCHITSRFHHQNLFSTHLED